MFSRTCRNVDCRTYRKAFRDQMFRPGLSDGASLFIAMLLDTLERSPLLPSVESLHPAPGNGIAGSSSVGTGGDRAINSPATPIHAPYPSPPTPPRLAANHKRYSAAAYRNAVFSYCSMSTSGDSECFRLHGHLGLSPVFFSQPPAPAPRFGDAPHGKLLLNPPDQFRRSERRLLGVNSFSK